jgi:hypothetical protein
MNIKEKFKEAIKTFNEIKYLNEFHKFKIIFHSCCESLASIYQLADKEQKKSLENKFFPEIIKIIREDNFHSP